MSTGEWCREGVVPRALKLSTSREDRIPLVLSFVKNMLDASSVVKRYALVIPALNEGSTIRDVTLQALQYVDNVIIVNDGSIDETSQTLTDLPVTVLTNTTTMGKAASLWIGFQHAIQAGAQVVVTIDGDGQHAPEDIPRILAVADAWDGILILGKRLRKDWRSALSIRVLANRVADFWISWAAGYWIADSQSGFRVYPVSLLQQLTIKHGRKESFVFESEVLIEAAKLGVRSVSVNIQARPPQGIRPSHFRPIVDIFRITKMVAWRLFSRGMYLRGLFQLFSNYSVTRTSPQVPFNGTPSHITLDLLSNSRDFDYKENRENTRKPQGP